MEKKIPFFKKVIISIKDLDKYNLLITEKMRRSIIYLLELMIIFTLIVSGVITYKINNLINEASKYIIDNVPNFTIDKEGLKLDSEESFTLENTENLGIKVILDDKTEDVNKYKEQIDEYDGYFLLLLKDKMVLTTKGSETEIVYDNLLSSNEVESINKKDVISIFNDNRTQINSIIYVSIFGSTYFIYTLSVFIDALVLSLLVIIISKMAKIFLKYSQAIIISISSLTLPIIINLIYTCANLINGFYMENFQIMYVLIAYIYIIAVILIMRSDAIKKRELIKATIDVKELEKKLENREDKEEQKKDEKKEKDEDSKKENKEDDEKKLDDAKRKVKGKEGPEPQANIEGGK